MNRRNLILIAGAAATLIAGHAWSVYHWRSDSLAPKIVNKARSSLYNVPAAVTEWAGLGTPIQPQLSTTNKGQITVNEDSSIFYLGQARIFIDDAGHITKGEVKLNTRLLEGYGSAAADHVLCQELGHILGLSHIDGDTCMNDAFATLGVYTAPNAHDAEQLRIIYGHIDGPKSKPGPKGRDAGRWVTIDSFPVPERP